MAMTPAARPKMETFCRDFFVQSQSLSFSRLLLELEPYMGVEQSQSGKVRKNR